LKTYTCKQRKGRYLEEKAVLAILLKSIKRKQLNIYTYPHPY